MIKKTAFNDYLTSFKNTLKSVFYEKDDIEKFIQKRGFPDLVIQGIMAQNPLSVGIPEAYGGRGAKVKECLGVMEAASYESLPLSLTFGINLALFLSPVAKYGRESVKKDVFNGFLNHQKMGGLMITEPDYGSDAMNMQTYNTKVGDKFRIQGLKHWQGLTGLADYWVMTSRSKGETGNLGRDIDFFVVDVHQPEQQIKVAERYNNLGLYPIPYGLNEIDITVPDENKLVPESTGLKLMMDLLHRSRMHFPGMGMGFIHRMLDEAITHCQNRFVGGKPLIKLDQVKFQISKIQSAFTVCSAMCSRSADVAGIENDLSGLTVEANSMKAYVTDLMQESAQTLTQLSGSSGYHAEHVGGRGIMDSRPFQIFEGSNEMLYTQISDVMLKLMRKSGVTNVYQFLKSYNLTQHVADYFKTQINFSIDLKLIQRKQVDLGKIISRVVCGNYLIQLRDKKFREDLIDNSMDVMRQEVAQLSSSFSFPSIVDPVEAYNENSNWLALT